MSVGGISWAAVVSKLKLILFRTTRILFFLTKELEGCLAICISSFLNYNLKNLWETGFQALEMGGL